VVSWHVRACDTADHAGVVRLLEEVRGTPDGPSIDLYLLDAVRAPRSTISLTELDHFRADADQLTRTGPCAAPG
jgi:hypothetical protein